MNRKLTRYTFLLGLLVVIIYFFGVSPALDELTNQSASIQEAEEEITELIGLAGTLKSLNIANLGEYLFKNEGDFSKVMKKMVARHKLRATSESYQSEKLNVYKAKLVGSPANVSGFLNELDQVNRAWFADELSITQQAGQLILSLKISYVVRAR